MKKIVSLTLTLALLISLTGCGKRNNLWKTASPSTSALALYIYDGITVTRGFIFDEATEKKILSSISSVKAEKAGVWSPEQVSEPVYALEIGSTDGFMLTAAWSNGYLITQDGNVYSFDYDFAALSKAYEWTSRDYWQDVSVLPCARLLSQNGNGWFDPMLHPADELTPPENVSAQFVGRTGNNITIKFINDSDDEWTYGEYFSIQVLLNDTWYTVPPVPGDWGFNDIATICPAGNTHQKSYDLTMYGDLPIGTYRLVAENLAVEFTV